MSEVKQKAGLKGKDLITIGIFTAIYLVLSFIPMMLGGIHPVLWILLPAMDAILGAVPFMIMTSKVKKPLAVLLMGAISGLVYFATGQISAALPTAFVAGSLIAEIIRYLSKYDNYWINTLCFAFFSLGMTGSPMPIWLYRERFFDQIAQLGMAPEYLSVLEKLASPAMLFVMFGATFAGAFAGSLIAKFMFRKHFRKAGIV